MTLSVASLPSNSAATVKEFWGMFRQRHAWGEGVCVWLWRRQCIGLSREQQDTLGCAFLFFEIFSSQTLCHSVNLRDLFYNPAFPWVTPPVCHESTSLLCTHATVRFWCFHRFPRSNPRSPDNKWSNLSKITGHVRFGLFRTTSNSPVSNIVVRQHYTCKK